MYLRKCLQYIAQSRIVGQIQPNFLKSVRKFIPITVPTLYLFLVGQWALGIHKYSKRSIVFSARPGKCQKSYRGKIGRNQFGM